MDKQISITQEELQKMLNIAVNQDRNKTDREFEGVTGCDIKCTLIYERNIRNGDKKILPVQEWCNQNDILSSMVFSILRDGTEEEEGYNYIEYPLDSKGRQRTDLNILTKEGFIELNGKDPHQSPFITTSNGTLFINDVDERMDNFIKLIKAHSLYRDDTEYSSKVKNRKLNYSRHELRIIKEIEEEDGIKIIVPVEELEDLIGNKK